MGAEMCELFISRRAAKYKDCGKKIDVHFDNSPFHHRRQDRWVSRADVEDGLRRVAVALGGGGFKFGVGGGARLGLLCLQETSDWRRQRSDAGWPCDRGSRRGGESGGIQAAVSAHLPTCNPRETGAGGKYRAVAIGADSRCKFPADSTSAGRGAAWLPTGPRRARRGSTGRNSGGGR